MSDEKSGGGPREQTTEPARDKIAAVIDEHTATGCEGVGLLNCWCGERFDTWAEHSLHAADAVVEALGLTEERRTLTDGWIQPFRNAGYISQGLKPPPAVITHEARWVSGWSVVGGEPK